VNLPDDGDTDNDGTEDGDEVVGTIASFQDPVLTIDLLGGGSVTGNVTPVAPSPPPGVRRTRLLSGQPVFADADVDGEGRIEVEGSAHCLLDQLRRGVHLVGRPLEEELVVDLQDQTRFEI
jgi:hypothetical protein